MQPCKFTFDDSPVFDGFAHGSTWNGFDNVAVTASERDNIARWFVDSSVTEGCEYTDVDDLMAIEAIRDTDPPLYSLGWGYATQIVREPRALPDNAAGMIAARFAVILHTWLSPKEWCGMVMHNAAEADQRICHSHDYCDSNMAMAEAFESIVGREPDVGDDADAALWNAAWEIAMPALGRK